jgi:hypothetical protein
VVLILKFFGFGRVAIDWRCPDAMEPANGPATAEALQFFHSQAPGILKTMRRVSCSDDRDDKTFPLLL